MKIDKINKFNCFTWKHPLPNNIDNTKHTHFLNEF